VSLEINFHFFFCRNGILGVSLQCSDVRNSLQQLDSDFSDGHSGSRSIYSSESKMSLSRRNVF